jgi:phosphoribosylaminoimidazole carboxylase (NCAIR synthetase)
VVFTKLKKGARHVVQAPVPASHPVHSSSTPGTQHTPVVLVNLLGDVWPDETVHPDWSPVLTHPRAKLHLYGKQLAKLRRKMGHFTVLADTIEKAVHQAQAIKRELMKTARG